MEFVPRSTWGALPPVDPLLPLDAEKIVGIVIHHTVTGTAHPQVRMRGIDQYHHSRGWGGGFAYCFAVSTEGEIFEGRGFNRGGATGRDWDYRTVSVAFIGTSGDEFPAAAADGLKEVIAYVRSVYGDHLWVKPHSDFKATECPGAPIRDWIASLEPEAVRTAPSGSEEIMDWSGLIALFTRLGEALGERPLRRWRKNSALAVAAVQARLTVRGYNSGVTDGKFGRRTQQAVKDFQRSQGHLRPNGRVGRSTWDALFIQ